MRTRQISLLLATIVILFSVAIQAQWTSQKTPFRALAITSEADTFWISGVGSGIASSKDGVSWTSHPVSGTKATLLGIAFFSKDFGYAFGTSGMIVMTVDGGETWIPHSFGAETILAASFADLNHGIFRTASTLSYVSDSEVGPVIMPKSMPTNFRYVPAVASLSKDRMSAEVSEGWKSRAGFVSTVDAGKTWTFYEPPHIEPNSLFQRNGEYWSVGIETVGYDKTGNGGLGVPIAIHSPDGLAWLHTESDTKVCHWEGCHACNVSGCMASAEKQIGIVNLYGVEVKVQGISEDHATSVWASANGTVCSIDQGVFCTPAAPLTFTGKPGGNVPESAQLPPLGTIVKQGVIRCIRCDLKPLYIDPKVEGEFVVHVAMMVGSDGTVESADITDPPSEMTKKDLLGQLSAWLFEPPIKDGKPVRVHLAQTIGIRLLRSR